MPEAVSAKGVEELIKGRTLMRGNAAPQIEEQAWLGQLQPAVKYAKALVGTQSYSGAQLTGGTAVNQGLR